jgi:hypothetical protein
MMEMRMGQRLLLALFATLALLSPSHAFEVEEGQCQRILSGQARVRMHYASGLQAEVDPVDRDNVNRQVEVFPDGRRVALTWIGGMLPLKTRWGRVIYADKEATRLRLEQGEARTFPFTYELLSGGTTSGTLVVAVERVNNAAFGECQATFATVQITRSWTGHAQPAKIRRVFVKELGFFIASTVEQVKDGKPKLETSRATRIELIR